MTTPLPLDEVADRYRRALGGGRVEELDLTLLDRTGVPTVGVVWSSPNGAKSSMGYGTSAAQATVGALGELCEGVFPDAAVEAATLVTGSYADLVRRHGEDGVADPLTLVLSSGSDYSPHDELLWGRARRWRTSEEVLVPVEFLASKPTPLDRIAPGREWLATPISNGLGAGSTLEQAVAHGLLELLQRDGDTVSFRALDQGVVFDTRSLGDPVLDGILDSLAGVGIDATVKLAADEFVPVFYCVGEDREPDLAPPVAMSAIGEGAHPDPRIAARKAVLEFAASRARRIMAFGGLDRIRPHFPEYVAEVEALGIPGGQEPRALAEMIAWCRMDHGRLRSVLDPIFRRDTVVTSDGLRSGVADPGPELLPLLLGRLEAFDVLVMEGTVPEAADIRTAKVVVPRIEVETLSYSRIGERVARRLLERGDALVTRQPGGGRQRVRLTEEAEGRLDGPVWLDGDRLAETLGELYPLYREPSWHAAPMTIEQGG